VAKPVKEKSGVSLTGTLEEERLEKDCLDELIIATEELITATEELVTATEALLATLLELRLEDCIDTTDEVTDELLDAPPHRLAVAAPPTVSESILAISCDPVARNRM
jgi:hypothetical protein